MKKVQETPKYVILKLREDQAKKLGVSHGAYKSDNANTVSMARFRRKMMVMMAAIFGGGSK